MSNSHDRDLTTLMLVAVVEWIVWFLLMMLLPGFCVLLQVSFFPPTAFVAESLYYTIAEFLILYPEVSFAYLFLSVCVATFGPIKHNRERMRGRGMLGDIKARSRRAMRRVEGAIDDRPLADAGPAGYRARGGEPREFRHER